MPENREGDAVIQNQRRSGSDSAPIFLLLGGIVAVVVEFLIDVLLSYTVKTTSMSVIYALGALEGLVTGGVVGGAAFLGRARHYGVAAVAGIVALIAGFIGDEAARLVIALLHNWPIAASTFTTYFTSETATWWALNVVPIVAAAGVSALSVLKAGRAPTPNAPPSAAWSPQPPFGTTYPGPGAGPGPYPPPAQIPYGPVSSGGPASWGAQPGPRANPPRPGSQPPFNPGWPGGPQPGGSQPGEPQPGEPRPPYPPSRQ